MHKLNRPPKTICHPAAANPLMRIVERREITEAAVQQSAPPSVTAQTMISRESPCSPLRSPGHNKNTIPANPTNTPIHPRIGSPSPRGITISISAAYRGIDATSSAARPLGIYCSAQITDVLPQPSISTPMIASRAHLLPRRPHLQPEDRAQPKQQRRGDQIPRTRQNERRQYLHAVAHRQIRPSPENINATK